MLLEILLASALSQNAPKSEPVPLTSIGIVSDEDAELDPEDPGTGGGLEVQSYFKTILRSPDQVRACFTRVEAAGAAWASRYELSRPVRRLDSDRLLVQYAKPGIGGIFELRYRVTTTVPPRARATLFFYRNDGSEQDPALVQRLLTTCGVSQLQDALDAALKCEPAA